MENSRRKSREGPGKPSVVWVSSWILADLGVEEGGGMSELTVSD